MINVVVIDDHPIVCDGLARMLAAEDDIAVVATGHDGDVAISLDAQLLPDVVLMDLSMRNVDGVEATRRIVNSRGDARVLILAGTVDTNRVLAAIDAGAVGFLIKDNDPHAIADGIRAAARGESPLDPRIARALVTDRYGRRAGVNLTERELEVLQMAANGMLNKQIGRALGIGEKTVKAHLGRIYDRLGVTNRTDAIAWALSAEMVTTGVPVQADYDGSYDGENLTTATEARPHDLVE